MRQMVLAQYKDFKPVWTPMRAECKGWPNVKVLKVDVTPDVHIERWQFNRLIKGEKTLFLPELEINKIYRFWCGATDVLVGIDECYRAVWI